MNFSSQSRVWLYLSSREFTESEVQEVNEQLEKFCVQWTAHGANLLAHGEVLHQRFILLLTDETHAGASGCSIDKSVHFIQEIERKYNTQLFNRLLVAFKDGENINVIQANDVKKLLKEGRLNENTPVFNMLVQTKEQLDSNFILPLKESWLARFLETVNT